MEFLSGKKTYLSALVVAVVAVLNYFGVLTPELVALLSGLGIAGIGVGLRAAKK